LWFCVDNIVWDKEQRVVAIPLHRKQDSDEIAKLIIRNVIALDVHDAEKIGWYDIDKVSLDSANTRILIEGNIPIQISIVVASGWTIYCAES
jgi:hypothetical protein